jgi:hypothetical protein
MFTVVSVSGVHIVVDVDCSPLGYDNVLVGKLLRLENHLNFVESVSSACQIVSSRSLAVCCLLLYKRL